MKACKNCSMVLSSRADICPNCKTSRLSDEWHGLVVIINPKKSVMAEKLTIKTPGKYALKVR
ncbi:MAG: DNA-directed RNA polymerase, subunit E'' [Methanomicrobia archaeon]|jgi:DNA-directed RNA polymerase subunit E"|nr:DNA-directed RNA polymerase, subunit E'' [Methanomicrobia archaeon]MCK4433205.1 DNA-directed RNA polymerase, subunit E'' [Methanomicrobia archaeon]